MRMKLIAHMIGATQKIYLNKAYLSTVRKSIVINIKISLGNASNLQHVSSKKIYAPTSGVNRMKKIKNLNSAIKHIVTLRKTQELFNVIRYNIMLI